MVQHQGNTNRSKKTNSSRTPPLIFLKLIFGAGCPMKPAEPIERMWASRAFFVCICLGKKSMQEKKSRRKKKEDRHENDDVNRDAKIENAHGFFACICFGKKLSRRKSAKENRMKQAWCSIKAAVVKNANRNFHEKGGAMKTCTVKKWPLFVLEKTLVFSGLLIGWPFCTVNSPCEAGFRLSEKSCHGSKWGRLILKVAPWLLVFNISSLASEARWWPVGTPPKTLKP